MNGATPAAKIVRLGPFSLDLAHRALFRGGELVPLTPKALDTLIALAAEPGRVFARRELIAKVWPDTFVAENSLDQNISAIRKALGDEITIETVPRRGYRLLVDQKVVELQPSSPDKIQTHEGLKEVRKPRPSFKPWVAAALLLAVACVLLLWTFLKTSRTAQTRSLDSLIVLPFVNLSPSPENDYFADGLTEELTGDLARIQGLRVVARTTAFQFQGKPRDVRDIGKQINVAAALEGSVRWQGSRVRVAAQLNSATDGYHVWTRTYEGDATDVFRIQKQIAQDIADALSRELRHSALPRSETENLQARNLYLEGTHLRNTTDGPAVRKAVLKFQQASQLDPNYSAPQAGLADCYAILAWGGDMRPEVAFKLAETAADRALSLDDNLSTAHKSKAIVELVFNWDWPKAEQEFRRAIELNPSDADAHHWFSHYLVVANRLDDSLRESERALELDPLNFMVNAHLSWHYLQACQFQAAVDAAKKTLALDPHNTNALAQMADAYEHLDDFQNAAATWRKADGYGQYGLLPDVGPGEQGAVRYWKARLDGEKRRPAHDEYHIARFLTLLGRKAEALDYLERAYANRNTNLIYIMHEPYFDALKGDERWTRLISFLNLNPR
ncbi:MAG: winged helix-turn-helix domain-containing protein [Acidobacteriaceae bacterium]|nr:winged helix-turn-helix domain-containing protein [Acidobacteriaceae bacterium]MBV8571504.1 winged helix-turn-helix domain-containing protein [Acidobacteriaceae bacterium]